MHLSDCRKKNSVGSVDQDPAGSHDSAVSNIGLKESCPINKSCFRLLATEGNTRGDLLALRNRMMAFFF